MTRIVAFCRNAWRTGNCNCRKSLVLTAFRCYGISLSLSFAIFEAWTDHLVNSSNTSRILVPTINKKFRELSYHSRVKVNIPNYR